MKHLLVKLSIAGEGATMKEKARAGICLYNYLSKESHNRVRVEMAVGRVIPVCATTVQQHLKLQE